MLNYIEYLNIPAKIALGLVITFFVIQIIGEILEFKGKVVPEFLKIRKYFKRKRDERIAFGKVVELLDMYPKMCATIEKTNSLLADFDSHYKKDNIAMRDKWIKEVNKHIVESEEKREKQDSLMHELSDKLDKNNAAILSVLIEHKRDSIIEFASKVIDENYPVTREQFNRTFKIYKEYEEIIEEHGLTNGEVDIAIHIIQESYEKHMKSHTFIEDVRGYNI